MKIGILTYHKVHNYGAILQAMALRCVLSDVGHEVYFVDYYPEYHQRVYSLFDWEFFKNSTLKRKIKYLLRLCFSFVNMLQRKRTFDRYIQEFIEPYCKPLNEEYDCVIYGSDQIWRKQPFVNEFNPIYFGDNSIKSRLKVSYAASFNFLPEEEDANHFMSLVAQLDKVSVREKQLYDYLCTHGQKEANICLDPTLLMNESQWQPYFSKERLVQDKYILLYDLIAESGGQTFDENELSRFAQRNNLKVVNLRSKINKLGMRSDRSSDNPADFINLIYHSEGVFTSSYHGVAFSLIMNKPMYCCFPTDSSRAEYLLEIVGLSDRMLNPLQKLPDHIEPIDYHKVNDRIESLRQKSLKYLSSLE